MVRTFIAVEPSPEIRKKIADAGASLKGAGRLAIVGPELMHITLKFLGEVPESLIPKIETALSSIHFNPYELTAQNISTFGRPPRVAKAEIHDCGKTAELAALIDIALKPLGFPKDDKPFSPHITLARVKDYSPALTEKIQPLREIEFGSCTINEVALKKSVLTPAGPIYTTIHRVKL